VIRHPVGGLAEKPWGVVLECHDAGLGHFSGQQVTQPEALGCLVCPRVNAVTAHAVDGNDTVMSRAGVSYFSSLSSYRVESRRNNLLDDPLGAFRGFIKDVKSVDATFCSIKLFHGSEEGDDPSFDRPREEGAKAGCSRKKKNKDWSALALGGCLWL